MPATPRGKHATRPRPAVTPADFERYLTTAAGLIAPADVTALVARAATIREGLVADRPAHPGLAYRAKVALHLLADHVRGECPQIPYQTVSLLATALLYYLAPMDVIPDFIPRVGKSDDAVVLEVAWRLAGPGVQRYLDWKGAAVDDREVSVGAIAMPASAAPRARQAAKPKRPAARGLRRKRP
jgi:uncharacterized membrane protein YkvA (DUF1232 family)